MRKEIIVNSAVREINSLHRELKSNLESIVSKAIRVGKLLIEQKSKLKHGEWLPWIESNLEFSQSTAYWYIQCYRNKKLLVGNNLTLKEAIKLMGPERRKRKINFEGRVAEISIEDIIPNPFWNETLYFLNIGHYYNSYKLIGFPYHILVVRKCDDKFQLVHEHNKFEAMKMHGFKKVMVAIVELDDKDMKDNLKWEIEMKSFLYEVKKVCQKKQTLNQ